MPIDLSNYIDKCTSPTLCDKNLNAHNELPFEKEKKRHKFDCNLIYSNYNHKSILLSHNN